MHKSCINLTDKHSYIEKDVLLREVLLLKFDLVEICGQVTNQKGQILQ